MQLARTVSFERTVRDSIQVEPKHYNDSEFFVVSVTNAQHIEPLRITVGREDLRRIGTMFLDVADRLNKWESEI